MALGRLSPNWLLSRIAGGYVELIRNLPLLFQILFWYLAVLARCPTRGRASRCSTASFLSNRGFVVPKPIAEPGLEPFALAVVIAIVGALLLRSYARKQLFDSGRLITIWPYVIGLLIGLPLAVRTGFREARHASNFPTSRVSIFPAARASFRNSWR